MYLILGIGEILIGIWQIYVSNKYLDNIRKQSSPLPFAVIALLFSLGFGAFLLVYGVVTLIQLR